MKVHAASDLFKVNGVDCDNGITNPILIYYKYRYTYT